MNKQEKEQFVNNVLKDIMLIINDNIHKMPESWNGIELRQYICDTVKEKLIWNDLMDKKRRKNYKNDVIVNNL